jgi:hypothetical protein
MRAAHIAPKPVRGAMSATSIADESREYDERSAPRDPAHPRGHLRDIRVAQYLVLEEIIGNVDA